MKKIDYSREVQMNAEALTLKKKYCPWAKRANRTPVDGNTQEMEATSRLILISADCLAHINVDSCLQKIVLQ